MSFVKTASVVLIIIALCELSTAKVYERCELVKEFRTKYQHVLKPTLVPTWVCIAYHESRFNTNATASNLDGSSNHGIFGISDHKWCAPKPPKNALGLYLVRCEILCSDLKTNVLLQSVDCAWKVYSDSGFQAWQSYELCDSPDKVNKFVEGC